MAALETAIQLAVNSTLSKLGINVEGRTPTGYPKGLGLKKDETADNSTKTLTVPDGKIWRVYFAFASVTTSGTGGSRQITLQLRDSGAALVYQFRSVAFSSTNSAVKHNYLGATNGVASLDGGDGSVPFPSELWLPAAFDMNFVANPLQSGDTLKAYAMVDEMDDT